MKLKTAYNSESFYFIFFLYNLYLNSISIYSTKSIYNLGLDLISLIIYISPNRLKKNQVLLELHHKNFQLY